MPFNGAGSNLSGASDVFFSGTANNEVLKYNSSTSKWNNGSLVGIAALPNGGGQETVATANATGATTLNLTNGNIFNITLTGNTTFSFSGATNGKACSFTLYKKQDSTGGRTVTWPGAVKWSGGAPTLTSTASSVDILVFESLDGGTTWYGSLVGANFS